MASHGRTLTRTITIVKLSGRVDGQEVIGWGECSALPAATYTAESAAGSFAAMADDLAPRLLSRELLAESVVETLFEGGPTRLPMATSALEMAILDASLRSAGRSLASWLGVEPKSVPAGASLSLGDQATTISAARALSEAGYGRLKVKVQPGHDVEPVAALRRALPEVQLHLDANGAYGPDAIDQVLSVIDCGADSFEQPFAPTPDSEPATVELIERLHQLADRRSDRPAIPIVADEAVQSIADAVGLLERRAMTGLSIKPGRVGGLIAAAELHDLCREHGLAATAGGMLETGLGRHALAALAGLDGFTLIGDLSPAGRWLAADPWPDLLLDDGRIVIHDGPGVAPEPDLDLLEHYTVDRRQVSAEPHP